MRVQDIQIEDLSLEQQYKSNVVDGNYEAAWDIVESNPQLDSKLFVADRLNDISDILAKQQNDYWAKVPTYMAALETAYNALIQQFILKAEWSIDVEYQKYNFVIYNNLIYIYINTVPSSGNPPTDTTRWAEIGLRGADGAPDIGVSLKYDWDATVEYAPLDAVCSDNIIWVAIYANTNQKPADGSTYWSKLVDFGTVGIETDVDAEPTKKYVGQIWLKKKG